MDQKRIIFFYLIWRHFFQSSVIYLSCDTISILTVQLKAMSVLNIHKWPQVVDYHMHSMSKSRCSQLTVDALFWPILNNAKGNHEMVSASNKISTLCWELGKKVISYLAFEIRKPHPPRIRMDQNKTLWITPFNENTSFAWRKNGLKSRCVKYFKCIIWMIN